MAFNLFNRDSSAAQIEAIHRSQAVIEFDLAEGSQRQRQLPRGDRLPIVGDRRLPPRYLPAQG